VAKILLAEDDPDVRDILADALRYAGHQVTEAPDGEIALQILTRDAFDVLLTDVRMPGKINGFALAREARKLHPIIKIICATGFTKEHGIEGDCDIVLRKPFALQTLKQALSRVLKL
jgi:CheY-like chemotaxis protein